MNPKVHAVIGIEEKAALAQAAESDRRRAAGATLSPLDGIPMTVKDACRVQGYRTSYGYWMFRNYRPRQDSAVVAALRARGAVFMGRSAVPTGSFDWNCKNQLHPECVNPHDASRTPGGSSGGAAAALATGMTPLEIGSDFHGSLRYPAHCCGVYSLRTTDGWLPMDDIGPEGLPAMFNHIVALGPMARKADDLLLMLDVLEHAFPIPQPRTAMQEQCSLKIALSKEFFGLSPDRATSELLDRMRERLVAQGHEVCDITPDFDWEGVQRDFGLIGGHESTAVFPRLLRTNPIKSLYARLVLQSRLGTGSFLTDFRCGMLADVTVYEAALMRREQLLAAVDTFFGDYDLWILPVAPSAALPLEMCGKKIPTEHGEVEYLRYLGAYLGVTAMMGTPVLTVPIGKDQDGMPIAVQVHGARFCDRRVVQLASQSLL